jgi:hypothetical protein
MPVTGPLLMLTPAGPAWRFPGGRLLPLLAGADDDSAPPVAGRSDTIGDAFLRGGPRRLVTAGVGRDHRPAVLPRSGCGALACLRVVRDT